MIKADFKSIKSKILTGCISLILIFMISLSFMLYTNKRNIRTIDYITEKLVPVTINLMDIQKDIKEIELLFYSASLSHEKIWLETSENVFSNLSEKMKYAGKKLQDSEFSDISSYFVSSKDVYETYYNEGMKMAMAYIEKGDYHGNSYRRMAFAPLSIRLQSEIDTIAMKLKDSLDLQIKRAEKLQELSQKIILILVILSTVLSVFISIRIANSLSKPISLIIKSTSKIAEGDLTYVPDYKKNDEIGKFSSNFKIAIDNLRKLIFEVKDASGNTVKISERVINSANRTSEDILNISDLLSTVEDQFKELSLSIGTTSESSEIISRNISSLTNQIEDQATAVTQTSTALEELSATINNVSVIASRNQKETQTLLETAD